MIRALHTRTYMIGRGSNKKASAKGAAAYRSASITAAAAYRSNDKIKNEIDGKIHDYSRKRGVVFSKIFLPVNAPQNFADRSTLWNEVERVENRKNSQFARQWEASFPPDFNEATRESLLTEFVKDFFVSQGMIADVAIHDVADRHGGRNIHTHVLLTLRRVDEKGFTGNKVREWNSFRTKYNLPQIWRVAWAERCNAIYEKMGLPTRIDPRSYEIQQNGLEPTKPIGKFANQLEKRGIKTDVGNKNREIIERNMKIKQNVLYDSMIAKSEEHEAERNELEGAKVTEQERAAMKNQIMADKEELLAAVEQFEEYEQLFAEINDKIDHFSSLGQKKAVDQLLQSKREATDNLMEKHDLTPETLQLILADYRGQLKVLDQYLEDLPDIENNPNYHQIEDEIELALEDELELEESRERTKER